jgi:hypothetical protein
MRRLVFNHLDISQVARRTLNPATAHAEAARRATDVAERDHLVRQAARARAAGLLELRSFDRR